MASQKNINDPNKFCYICDEYLTEKQRISITQNIKTNYFEYFKIKNLDTSYVTQLVGDCYQVLKYWIKGKRNSM